MMANISLKNVSVHFPVLDGSNGRHFINAMLKRKTGGAITSHKNKIAVEALQNISFELENGDRLGLIGHNGAGKTTLLKVLSKIYEPSSGSISIQGKIGSLLNLTTGLNSELSGRENIYLYGLINKIPRTLIDQEYDALIKFIGIGDFINLPLRTYSAGMLLRLGFTLATISNPEILIIDEIIQIGDQDFINKAKAKIKDRFQTAKIFVLASHSMEDIKNFCNKVIWMEGGRIKAFGSTAEIIKDYSNYT